MFNVKKFDPQILWLISYVVLNVIFGCLIVSNSELYGEVSRIPPPDAITMLLLVSALVISYLVVCGLFYKVIVNIKIPRFKIRLRVVKVFEILISLLQLSFLIFCMVTGLFIAGQSYDSASIYSVVWVLVPVDALMYVYYGALRERATPNFWLNVTIWIVSSFYRGWSGVLLTVVFFESCIWIRKNGYRLTYLLPLLLVSLSLYPILLTIKLAVRLGGQRFLSSVDQVVTSFQGLGYIDLILLGVNQIFERLQLVSSLAAVYQLRDKLSDLYGSGSISAFWLEGIHGTILSRVLGKSDPASMGRGVAKLLDPEVVGIVNWNSNPTLTSWLIVSPLESVSFVLYIIVVVSFFGLMMRFLSDTKTSKDAIFYMLLVIVIPGWLGAMILYLYAVLLFFLILCIIELLLS